MREITSLANPWVKHIRQLGQKKYRQQYGAYIAEGERLVRSVTDSGHTVRAMAYSASYLQAGGCTFPCEEAFVLPDALFAKLCETEHPQGVLAVVAQHASPGCTGRDRYLYCDRITDPGNLGTIIRSADAFGFGGIILSPGCADPFSPKVVRSAMGSLCGPELVLPPDGIALLTQLKEDGYTIYASALSDGCHSLYDIRFSQKLVLVIGNEANGVSESVLALSDAAVRIPMYGGAESFNAAVAASILLYEVRRQAAEGRSL